MPGQMPEGEKLYKGEITAYLSIVFILLVTFMGAALESASIQTAKNYYRANIKKSFWRNMTSSLWKEAMRQELTVREGFLGGLLIMERTV